MYHEIDPTKNDFYVIMKEMANTHKTDVAKKQEISQTDVKIDDFKVQILDKIDIHMDD